jgi:hypothetical protein
VVLQWHQNDKQLQSVDITPLNADDDSPRMRVLGAPDIIGQCIIPVAAENDLKLVNVQPSPRHSGLFETPVTRLDTNLEPMVGPIGKVKEISINCDVHLVLMEMNVSLAYDFMLRDFLRSDFSAMMNARKLEANIKNYNELLSAERSHMASLKARYKSLVGLDLSI